MAHTLPLHSDDDISTTSTPTMLWQVLPRSCSLQVTLEGLVVCIRRLHVCIQ